MLVLKGDYGLWVLLLGVHYLRTKKSEISNFYKNHSDFQVPTKELYGQTKTKGIFSGFFNARGIASSLPVSRLRISIMTKHKVAYGGKKKIFFDKNRCRTSTSARF